MAQKKTWKFIKILYSYQGGNTGWGTSSSTTRIMKLGSNLHNPTLHSRTVLQKRKNKTLV